jgi:hypothetical protein
VTTLGRSTVFLFALAAVALPATSAHAFCRTAACGKDCAIDPITNCPIGTPIWWPQYCVSYSMQYQASRKVDLEKATAAAEKAFYVWQNAPCPGGGVPSIKIDHTFGPVACKMHEYNQVDGNANIIMFHDDVWPYSGGTDVLALTTVTFSKKTGDIYDVDMEINGLQPLSTSDPVDPEAYDLQSIITHEAGHFLGLGHSLVPDATMWTQYTTGTDSFRDLADDDIAGICTTYPPTQEPQICDFVPRQGFSPECGLYPAGAGTCALARGVGGAGGGGAWSLALASAIVALATKRRRRSNSLSLGGGSGACGAGASTNRPRRSAAL